ncbi:MAG: glucans biosynthesis protein [Bradyrhizobium sp.]|nr:MAG: glucans biosynthesis protein [Bradyrhizobium sp.]
MPESARRDFLKLALGGAFAAASVALERGASAASMAAPTPFSVDSLLDMARELAKAPFKAPDSNLPDPFAKLTAEQYLAIRPAPNTAVWSDDKTGFEIEPLHRGFIFAAPVDIYIVDNGQSRRLVYDRSAFDFGKLQTPANLPDIGFSGVRVLDASDAQGWRELAIFQGATFFRSLARGQSYGLNARGLSIRTGDAQGEEFPLFRALWIERPTVAVDALTIHALLDSTSVTGAFHFTLRPGEATIIDTQLTLVGRVAVDRLGLSPMTSTYVFGPLDHHRTDDARAAAYDIGGLQILTGANEWLWRPIASRDTLQISAFADKNPRGFGLLQRARTLDTFYDDDARWEMRPSLWIEPIGDWGEGEVILLEIPSNSEFNDNVIAQWRPKANLEAGATISFAYRQFWCWTPPARPSLATVVSSRGGKIGKRLRFSVEFASDLFADPQKAAQITADVAAAPGQVVATQIFPYKDRRSIRVVFDVEPGSEPFSEMRLLLKTADQPMSETWLYRWTA